MKELTLEEQIEFMINMYLLCGSDDDGKAKNKFRSVMDSLIELKRIKDEKNK